MKFLEDYQTAEARISPFRHVSEHAHRSKDGSIECDEIAVREKLEALAQSGALTREK